MRRIASVLTATALASLIGCSDGSSRPVPTTDNPPSISAVPDSTVPANSAELRLAFTVDDDQTAPSSLMVSVTSDSADLFSDAGPVIAGDGSDRELVVTPAPGTVGMATITITVTDAAGQEASTSFFLAVAPERVGFGTALRTAFAADANDEPQTINDKEYVDDDSNFDDLLRN